MKIVSALVVFVLGLSVSPLANSSTRTFTSDREIQVNERLQEAKPVAGRNRRRSKSPVLMPTYPKANADNVRVSRQLNKLRINVLSNDKGNKPRVVNINSRSAVGAKVVLRNGMAVYQMPSNFVGKDSFWYTMEDTSGRRHSAKVVVCICDK